MYKTTIEVTLTVRILAIYDIHQMTGECTEVFFYVSQSEVYMVVANSNILYKQKYITLTLNEHCIN